MTPFTSNKLAGRVLGLSLAALAVGLYLSPAGKKLPGGDPTGGARPAVAAVPTPSAAAPATKAAAATSSASRSSSPSPTPAKSTGITRPSPGSPSTGRPSVPAPGSTPSGGAANPQSTKTYHCYDFKWQQDAQAVYLSNLSDPWGLDANVGPNDGDGIACTGLPQDPTRPASVPVGAYVAPPVTAATKAALTAPSTDYYGVAQNGIPGDSKMLDSLAQQVGKAPSAVGWFSGWDAPYSSAQVQAAWTRGALPVITWMTKATLPGSTEPDSDFSFTKILAGNFDAYLYKFAGDVVRTNLPVVIRFDHEMNGNWYPWGAGAYNNTPDKYKAAWQHVWNIFEQVGANQQAIWLYAPARVDNLSPHGSSADGQAQTTIAEDYPGDAYVDLVGATVYMRSTTQGSGYATSFAKTLNQLKAVSSKPIFLPEIGAIETSDAGADVAGLKVQWINNTIAGILADPRIIGFVWFNNVAAVPGSDGNLTNDWRFNSSPSALAAFQTAVSDGRFLSGVMPDSG